MLNHYPTKLSFKITLKIFFFFHIFPRCREGDSASGFRGILESWSIESFSGPVSRRPDKKETKHCKPQLKDLHMCSGGDFLFHCCRPGISPILGDWPQSQMCRASKMHKHAHTSCVHYVGSIANLTNFEKSL